MRALKPASVHICMGTDEPWSTDCVYTALLSFMKYMFFFLFMVMQGQGKEELMCTSRRLAFSFHKHLRLASENLAQMLRYRYSYNQLTKSTFTSPVLTFELTQHSLRLLHFLQCLQNQKAAQGTYFKGEVKEINGKNVDISSKQKL